MDDNVARLPVVGRIIRRRWPLLLVLAMLGAGAGFGASLLFSPGYESASKVLLQGVRDEQVMLTETQIARSSVVLDRTAAILQWGISGDALRRSVAASVVDGNVIEIKGTAATPERAQQLTDRATQEYVKFSTQLSTDAEGASADVLQQRRAVVQQRIVDGNARITALQASPDLNKADPAGGALRAELDRQRGSVVEATRELDAITTGNQGPVGRSSISLIEPAAVPTDAAPPTLLQLIATGAVLFIVLGVLAYLVAARTDQRLLSAADISSVLGAPVVGSVEVPKDKRAKLRRPKAVGWRARFKEKLREHPRWDGSEIRKASNDFDQRVRYRRVLARLRGAPENSLKLLVLFADDDGIAEQAVVQLVAAAGVDGAPGSVITDIAKLSELLHTANGALPPDRVGMTVRPSAAPAPPEDRTVLRIVEVSAAGPTVPDSAPVAGVLVVLTAGTRTPWEVVSIAEACGDAGHSVVGALVAHVVRPSAGSAGRPAQADAHAEADDGSVMAGTA